MTSPPGHGARAGARHVFRFFVDEPGGAGATVALAAADAHHVAVLRLTPGALVEVVDDGGTRWRARLEPDARVTFVEHAPMWAEPPAIELVAGALVGGRFDELVDGAVQAGATRIVPFVSSRRDGERLASRTARLERIARAAAKQSGRSVVPTIGAPLDADDLREGPAGIMLDPRAPQLLDQAVRDGFGRSPASLRMLVGPADGLHPQLVESLLAAGWSSGRLGPTILRSELAAAVAVAVAAMHAAEERPGSRP